MNSRTEKEYPMNLYRIIFGEEAEANYPDDAFETVEYLLGKIATEKTQKVMKLYFQNRISATKIGEALGITSSRVYQIIHNGEAKLRWPGAKSILSTGITNYRKAEYERINKIREEEAKKEAVGEALQELLNQPIVTFLDQARLRVRAYNCLRRAMKDDCTVKDLVDAIVSGKIRKVRNLGESTRQEIIGVLIESGIPKRMLSEEKYEESLSLKSLTLEKKLDLDISLVNRVLDKPINGNLYRVLANSDLGSIRNVIALINNEVLLEVPGIGPKSMSVLKAHLVNSGLMTGLEDYPESDFPFTFYFQVFQDISVFDYLSKEEMLENFRLLGKFITHEQYEILTDKFMNKMTDNELSDKYKMLPESVSEIIMHIIKYLRTQKMSDMLKMRGIKKS